MKCRDFERLINEQLDAREAASPEVERALESHGSACPACRTLSLRYQALRQAISAWSAPPVAPPDFAARFLEHWEHTADGVGLEEPTPPTLLKVRPAYWPVAVAAAAAAALL